MEFLEPAVQREATVFGNRSLRFSWKSKNRKVDAFEKMSLVSVSRNETIRRSEKRKRLSVPS